MRFFLLISFIIISYVDGFSQGCCSGGVGSPIAGGVATGVMQKNQLEFSFFENNEKIKLTMLSENFKVSINEELISKIKEKNLHFKLS